MSSYRQNYSALQHRGKDLFLVVLINFIKRRSSAKKCLCIFLGKIVTRVCEWIGNLISNSGEAQ